MPEFINENDKERMLNLTIECLKIAREARDKEHKESNVNFVGDEELCTTLLAGVLLKSRL